MLNFPTLRFQGKRSPGISLASIESFSRVPSPYHLSRHSIMRPNDTEETNLTGGAALQWTAFFTYVLITSFTPGPNIVLAMNTARLCGLSETLPLIAGMFTGLVIVMANCAVFNILLAQLLPSVLPFLRIAGAAYILRLAWLIAFPANRREGGTSQGATRFREGLVLQFLNPKVILLGLSTLSTFILPWTSSKAWLFGCSLFLTLMCTSGVFLWALIGAAQKTIKMRREKLWDLLMGGLLAWCAISVSGLADLLS
jgi:cysteine/O-acetylserine efflux protein